VAKQPRTIGEREIARAMTSLSRSGSRSDRRSSIAGFLADFRFLIRQTDETLAERTVELFLFPFPLSSSSSSSSSSSPPPPPSFFL